MEFKITEDGVATPITPEQVAINTELMNAAVEFLLSEGTDEDEAELKRRMSEAHQSAGGGE